MNPKPSTSRTCGFRLSWLDAMILLLGKVLSCWLPSQSFPLWWIVSAALGHFALFCHVFLVWRRLELLWALAFVLNVAAHFVLGAQDWLSTMLYQLPFTVLVIMWQIRSPWYHGIFAERLNPRSQRVSRSSPVKSDTTDAVYAAIASHIGCVSANMRKRAIRPSLKS